MSNQFDLFTVSEDISKGDVGKSVYRACVTKVVLTGYGGWTTNYFKTYYVNSIIYTPICHGNLFYRPFTSNVRLFWLYYFGFQAWGSQTYR